MAFNVPTAPPAGQVNAAAKYRHSYAPQLDYAQTTFGATAGAERERLESVQSWTTARPPPPELPSREQSASPTKSAAPMNEAGLQPPGPRATGAGGTSYPRNGYGASQALDDGFGEGRKADIYGGAIARLSRPSKDSLSYKWVKRASSFLDNL